MHRRRRKYAMRLEDLFETELFAADRAANKGFNLRLYHGTSSDFEEFAPFSHFGTAAQASMRAGTQVIPVFARLRKIKRLRDNNNGQWNAATLRSLERKGYDGIIYLNRYEGIPKKEFEDAYEKGIDLDKVSDSQFRKLIPSAEDSYIIFDPNNVKSIHAKFEPLTVGLMA